MVVPVRFARRCGCAKHTQRSERRSQTNPGYQPLRGRIESEPKTLFESNNEAAMINKMITREYTNGLSWRVKRINLIHEGVKHFRTRTGEVFVSLKFRGKWLTFSQKHIILCKNNIVSMPIWLADSKKLVTIRYKNST